MAFRAKRKFRRTIQREGVKLLTPKGTEYATYEDVSAGGIKLWLDHEIEAGTPVEVEFSLPQLAMKQLRSLGRVVHCRLSRDGKGYECGIEFTEIPTSTQAIIERFIEPGEGPF